MIIEYMEKYPDLARGFIKRDKTTVESLWQQLAESLYGTGPPQKDVNGWKKKQTELKSDVKRKLAQNKAESKATDGGPFSKHQFAKSEEAFTHVCGISQSVEGVADIAIGLAENVGGGSEKEIPSTSTKRPLSPLFMISTPKRYKKENTGEWLKKFLDADSRKKVELNKKLDQLLKIAKENASNLRRVYRAIEKGHESVKNVVEKLKTEYVRVNRGILQAMQEKNELRKKHLELEILKFEYQKNKE